MSGITLPEWLLRKAHYHWSEGIDIPGELYFQMTNAGIDLDAARVKFDAQQRTEGA